MDGPRQNISRETRTRNSHAILTLHASRWANDSTITLQMSGQAGREATLRAGLPWHQTRMSACPPFPPEARVWRAPQPEAERQTYTAHLLWCGSDYVVHSNRMVKIWQRPILGPDMSELGVLQVDFVGSVRTHLQHFVVRDQDHQEGRI